MNKTVLSAIIMAIVLVILVTVKSQTSSLIVVPALDQSAVILAYGDSLTFGKGVTPDQAYPAHLERISGLHVINAGVSGERSSAGLARLADVLDETEPDLVVLCHGGNDIIQRRSHEQLHQNLLRMITLIRRGGAQVLLIGVPDVNLLGFSTASVYDDVAEETGVMYEAEVLNLVLADRVLKSDRIHPNTRGYRLMAEAFFETLKESGTIF